MKPYRIVSSFVRIDSAEYIRRFRDAERFAGFCRACTRYDACWACPPFGFDTGAYLSGRRFAWIVGTRITPADELRTACSTADESIAAGRTMIRRVRCLLDERLLTMEARYLGSRAFFAGTCMSCPEGECSRREKQPCRNPQRMRPSLEAFGLDMARTSAELLGVEMKWSRSGELPDYFTLVSGFFTNSVVGLREWEEVFG